MAETVDYRAALRAGGVLRAGLRLMGKHRAATVVAFVLAVAYFIGGTVTGGYAAFLPGKPVFLDYGIHAGPDGGPDGHAGGSR